MTISKGDLVLIPFPFTDLSTAKQRPALIVSSNWFNRQQNDIIVMAITSQIPVQVSTNEYLLSPADLRDSGLPKASIVKLGKIVTIDQKLVKKRLGKLSERTMLSILDDFLKILGHNLHN